MKRFREAWDMVSLAARSSCNLRLDRVEVIVRLVVVEREGGKLEVE